MQYFLIALLIFALGCSADPKPTGGANCTHDFECFSSFGGHCVQNVCDCPASRGNPDCSYKRVNAYAAGGAQLICLIGIGGIGSYMLGHNGYGVGETIFGFGIAILWIVIISYIVHYRRLHQKEKIEKTVEERDSKSKAMWMFQGNTSCMYIQLAIYILWGLIGLSWNLARVGQMFGGSLPDNNGYATYY